MPSNQTPNYGLSKWAKSDRVLMDDFNADNAKIDAALAGQLRIHTGSYTGENLFETTIPLPFRPKFFWLQQRGNADRRIMIFGDTPVMVHLWNNVSTVEGNGTGVTVTVNDDNVHLRAISSATDFERYQYAMNSRGTIYLYVALG